MDSAQPLDGKESYIYVRHHENGVVSRVLKPAYYKDRIAANDTVQPGQAYAAVIFEPSLGAKPDRDAVYGLIQITGCFPNEDECLGFIRKRVLNQDRKDEYLLMPCGSFVPLSTAPAALRDVELVDLPQKLHGEYQDAQFRRHEREVEEVKAKNEKLRREQENATETDHRENTLQKAEKADDLKSYVRLRVARASARAAAHRMHKQLMRITEMRDKMHARAQHYEDVLRQKDVDHPNYAHEYLDIYTATLISACTMVQDDNDDADYNYLNYDEEEPIRLQDAVNPHIKEQFKKQSHEYDDDTPPQPANL